MFLESWLLTHIKYHDDDDDDGDSDDDDDDGDGDDNYVLVEHCIVCSGIYI